MTKPAILHLEGITKHFEQTTEPAVGNVSFTLHEGDLLGLVGPSGCGKTTLLRIVAGFERPQAGLVVLAGRKVTGPGYWLPPEQRNTGMVFQDYALFPHLTVAENVAFGLKQNRKQKSGVSVKNNTEDAIALVGLAGMGKRYPHELSGGQQQRVALARALAPRPKLILLDEPLSNLDVQVRLRLRQEVRAILKETGTSAIFVTHDQEEALSISDQVGVMRSGRLEQLGTPEEIYTNPSSRFVAEFVTQANFLPAQRRGDLWETEVGSFAIRVNDAILNTKLDQLEEGELMLREENVLLKPDDDSTVVIQDRHFLGREYRYCLQTASGKKLHARTNLSTQLPVGKRVRLSVADPSVPIFA
ncbi:MULTISPECIES: ABC transporter ATP-binding protein [unclassified Moorena]|uniref:ABC transporter ATP-binding protein n=1 Tax=unclassified Moorena TaxID=2683338 RepID=UPI0013C202F9|nr:MULTISPECIES: ABC transporter ATP-binding protein [unclassified Moorena]NEO06633.1 ABC transporter ATP-binding protein [Moorena sp. SIO3I8]NEO19375.1 ABC transporter ATP-binding protein [Moorena sp. SIO4A5]NEP21840.1 ABC transporter ATP-binding protein [Moorena sp. SIO3I6]NEQ58461.1 ABC transporter ATP-binding protein [Moorena sp. SIO4A1]